MTCHGKPATPKRGSTEHSRENVVTFVRTENRQGWNTYQPPSSVPNRPRNEGSAFQNDDGSFTDFATVGLSQRSQLARFQCRKCPTQVRVGRGKWSKLEQTLDKIAALEPGHFDLASLERAMETLDSPRSN